MIRSFLRLTDKKVILLLVLTLIASPTFFGKNTYTVCLIYSHYLTTYLNNVFLLFIYQYASRLNALHDFFIIRIQEKKFYSYTYIILIGLGLLYNLIIYVSYYFFFGSIPQEYMSLTLYFMVINMIITTIETHIVYAQIGEKKNFAYLAIPILINFLFHLIFTNLY